MKKIMFNDTYCLTDAVLQGKKTQTRRLCKEEIRASVFVKSGYETIHGYEVVPLYQVGEVVAIAQSYKSLGYDSDALNRDSNLKIRGLMKDSAGWNNKMFVRVDACKKHIKVTGVRCERLQDISDEDCFAEGVAKTMDRNLMRYCIRDDWHRVFYTPQRAFAFLIDKISGKGTWERKPFVWAYEFELID